MRLDAPFPWFGGKRRVAAEVWHRFGAVDNYVEPFFGSGAVLLNRPTPHGLETINDKDGYVANFWRALAADPDAVAHWADWPVNENDLHARHTWLLPYGQTLAPRLDADPDFYDAKVAGWWVWGLCCWIGSGFCSGQGPWQVRDGQLVHLGNNGRGVNRQRATALVEWFRDLAARLQDVRVCCGDWSRVCSPSVTFKHGLTAVLLDPPYADTANRQDDLYRLDSTTVAHDVREWAIENGANPLLRIALCGYEGEHVMPSDWAVHEWSAGAGYGTGNGDRERIWFSPSCLPEAQPSLFDAPEACASCV